MPDLVADMFKTVEVRNSTDITAFWKDKKLTIDRGLLALIFQDFGKAKPKPAPTPGGTTGGAGGSGSGGGFTLTPGSVCALILTLLQELAAKFDDRDGNQAQWAHEKLVTQFKQCIAWVDNDGKGRGFYNYGYSALVAQYRITHPDLNSHTMAKEAINREHGQWNRLPGNPNAHNSFWRRLFGYVPPVAGAPVVVRVDPRGKSPIGWESLGSWASITAPSDEWLWKEGLVAPKGCFVFVTPQIHRK
jgi:hypothetical protein